MRAILALACCLLAAPGTPADSIELHGKLEALILNKDSHEKASKLQFTTRDIGSIRLRWVKSPNHAHVEVKVEGNDGYAEKVGVVAHRARLVSDKGPWKGVPRDNPFASDFEVFFKGLKPGKFTVYMTPYTKKKEKLDTSRIDVTVTKPAD